MSRIVTQYEIDEHVARLQRLWDAGKKANVVAGELNSALREYDVSHKQVDAILELVDTVLQFQWLWTIGNLRQNLDPDAAEQIIDKIRT